MLNDLDHGLTKRGHRFVWYADDFMIFFKSIRAGQRVLESVNEYIEKKLKLKVNRSKSQVDYYNKGNKLLGFGFYYSGFGNRKRQLLHWVVTE